MTGAIVKYVSHVSETALQALSDNLQDIVANNLSCKDTNGWIAADEVEIEFRQLYGPLDRPSGDADVMIHINTTAFPSLEKVLEERNALMSAKIISLLSGADISDSAISIRISTKLHHDASLQFYACA